MKTREKTTENVVNDNSNRLSLTNKNKRLGWLKTGLFTILFLAIQHLSVSSAYSAVFTAKLSGAWNLGTTWDRGTVPGSADDVIIPSGFSILLPVNAAVKNLTIQSGGSLLYAASGVELTIANGGKFTVEANGYLRDNLQANTRLRFAPASKTSFDYNFLVNGEAETDLLYVNNVGKRFTLQGTGIINVFDKFTVTEDAMTVIFDAGVRVNVTNGIDIGKNSDKRILFENHGIVTVGGNIDNGNPGNPLNTRWNNRDNAILNLGGIFDPRLDLFASFANNLINYNGAGTKAIKHPMDLAYHHLTISNSNIRYAENHVDVNGNLTITDAAAMDMSAYAIGWTTYNIKVAGNWTNNSTTADPYVERNCFATLDGATHQYVTVPNGETFCKLTVNNTSTGVSLLSGNVNIKTALTLTDGIVYTTNTAMMVVKDNATSTPGSAASFVDGPMKKVGDEAFIFPVGDQDTVWARVGLKNIGNFDPSTEVVAEYFFGDYPYQPTLEQVWQADSGRVSGIEYWNMNRAYDPGNDATAQVELYWENDNRSEITDLSDLVVGEYSLDSAHWVNQFSAGTTGTADGLPTISSGSVTSANLIWLTQSFSPVTFGSRLGINPLPVELISFNGKAVNDRTIGLYWSTATEINSNRFELERSKDGKNFIAINKQGAAGNETSVVKYQYFDENPFNGTNYYRLKQVDNNGKYKYSNAIAIAINKEIRGNAITLYPNPAVAGESIYVELAEASELPGTITLYDQMGKTIHTEKVEMQEGNTKHALDINNNLPSGIYFLVLDQQDNISRQKLVIR